MALWNNPSEVQQAENYGTLDGHYYGSFQDKDIPVPQQAEDQMRHMQECLSNGTLDAYTEAYKENLQRGRK